MSEGPIPANTPAIKDQVPSNLNWAHFLLGRNTIHLTKETCCLTAWSRGELVRGKVLTSDYIWRKWLKKKKKFFW